MAQLKREPYNPLLKSYPDSEKVNAVSIGAETLFTRLIAQADDNDHYYADPGMVLGKLFTRRMCAGHVQMSHVECWLAELEAVGLVVFYQFEGRKYLEIINRRKDLRSDVKMDIRSPVRTENDTETHSGRIRPEAGVVSFRQPNPTEPNPTEPIKDAAHPRPPGADTLPAGFVLFWSAWPKHFRKQGRKNCLAKWKKLKLEPIAEKVIDALELCKASPDWQKNSGDFIPFPLTWLNRAPWETDPAEMTSANDPVTPTNGEHGPRDMTPEEDAAYHAAED
jgi:hypothetical protein